MLEHQRDRAAPWDVERAVEADEPRRARRVAERLDVAHDLAARLALQDVDALDGDEAALLCEEALQHDAARAAPERPHDGDVALRHAVRRRRRRGRRGVRIATGVTAGLLVLLVVLLVLLRRARVAACRLDEALGAELVRRDRLGEQRDDARAAAADAASARDAADDVPRVLRPGLAMTDGGG